jgi:hypothetical protein
MKACTILILAALSAAGCQQDPRVPLDQARHDINDIQAFQLQAERLRPSQEELERALRRDARVLSTSVGFSFSSSGWGHLGARLTVEYVLLLELKKDQMPSTQPAELDKFVQDLVRDALTQCGWDIEEVNTYRYENQWRVRGQVRGQGRPPSAGAGLDLLPDRKP